MDYIINKSGRANEINPVTDDKPYKYRLVVCVQSYYFIDHDKEPYKTFTYVLESKPYKPDEITKLETSVKTSKIIINTVECIEVTKCPENIEWRDTTQIRVKEKEDKPIYDTLSGTKPIIEQTGFTFQYVDGNFYINDEEIKAMLRERMTWAGYTLLYNISYKLGCYDKTNNPRPISLKFDKDTRYKKNGLNGNLRDDILSVKSLQSVTEKQIQQPVTEAQVSTEIQPVNETQVSTEIQPQPVTETQPQTPQTTSGGRKRKTKKTHKKRKTAKKHHKKRKTAKK